MNREYNRVSSKNSEQLLKNLNNTTGLLFAAPCTLVMTNPKTLYNVNMTEANRQCSSQALIIKYKDRTK